MHRCECSFEPELIKAMQLLSKSIYIELNILFHYSSLE